MRYIDKDMAIKLIDKGWISDSEGIESIDEENVISIDYLLKGCTEAVFKREMTGDSMKAIHHIIAKWREENESTADV